MKKLHGLILLVAVFLSFNFLPKKVVLPSKPIAIAELFTSEGCSSCPDAEDLLKEMAGMTAKESISIVGLAFHITYWDRLGWKDPYGQPEFTNRQKKYGEILSTQQYTPQVVINGEYEFVGGNPIAYRDALAKVASKPAVYELDATATLQGSEITVNYKANKKTKSELLNIALVEPSIENLVKRGENKDRLLKHYNVVRKFETVNIAESGELKITAPEGLDLNKCEIVLYVQHRRNLKILGASQIDLNSNASK